MIIHIHILFSLEMVFITLSLKAKLIDHLINKSEKIVSLRSRDD